LENTKIVPVRIGFSNSVLLVNGSKSILVDTGYRGHISRLKSLFREQNLKPADIKVIILTHTHYDHTGNLIPLVELTGAKVLVHKNEFENLKKGFTPIPKGLGIFTGFVSWFGKIIYPKYASPKPFVADIINENEFDLKPFGTEAKVISTPGHTEGSQAVLLGEKLVSGDAFINLRNGTFFPHFANQPDVLLETWEKVFEMGIKMIYPGHGPEFTIEKAFPEFERWKKKLS